MPFSGIIENIIAFLAVLMPVVFFHELGHFWVARRAGVVVDVFSIGFGPVLLKWRDKLGTQWQIAALPLGGFVKMRGDMNAASQAATGASEWDGSFAGASVLRRFAIVAAGPIANFLLAIVLFAGVYVGFGKAFIPAEIGEVSADSAAEQAGLRTGDIVLSIDGTSISDFSDMRAVVMQNADKPIILELDRQGQIQTTTITPKPLYVEQLGTTIGVLGVTSAGGEMRSLGVAESLYYGSVDVGKTTVAMVSGIFQLITGNASMNDLGGPVRIAEFSGDAARNGFLSFVMFTALISINLGLVNLLPIPALDGGHLVMFSIEAVIGRPLPEVVQNLLLRGGVAFLLSLMIFVTIFDVMR